MITTSRRHAEARLLRHLHLVIERVVAGRHLLYPGRHLRQLAPQLLHPLQSRPQSLNQPLPSLAGFLQEHMLLTFRRPSP